MKTLATEGWPFSVLQRARAACRLVDEALPVVYCPTCRDDTVVGGHGRCLWCDTPLGAA